ncbi:MAG: aminotransferase class V-fold PLP-dependent enzyme [Clostridia bacterium]|nr:aminotransferase class V-fold PLP-dependent enzyme [Clostridia bacterium]
MEIYLDNAATSHPKPLSVIEAVNQALTEYNGNPGRSGHQRALRGARLLMQAREDLAHLLNVPENGCVAFCFNGTDALNAAIKGSLHVGDHVVSTMLEHNSVLRVLKGLEKDGLIEVTLLEPDESGTVSAEQFEAARRKNTALAISTHVSNVTGAIQPVAAIGSAMRQCGVRFLIDGAQAVGHMPVDVQALQCSLYAFPGHKGLLGPQGTGGLYIAPETPLRTFREGGTGSSSEAMLQPADMPEGYESGTVNLPGIAGLKAGVEIVRARLAENFMRERQLTSALYNGLTRIRGVTVYSPAEEAARGSVVSFNINGTSSSSVADYLDRKGIAVRGGLHCAPGVHQLLGTLRSGAVRASPSWQNSFDDIESLLRALRSYG